MDCRKDGRWTRADDGLRKEASMNADGGTSWNIKGQNKPMRRKLANLAAAALCMLLVLGIMLPAGCAVMTGKALIAADYGDDGFDDDWYGYGSGTGARAQSWQNDADDENGSTEQGVAKDGSGQDRPVLKGYENTVWGVTGPDGQVVSGYTWEMYSQAAKERAKDGIRLKFDGFQVEFPDQKPILDESRVLVPMRPVFESAKVQCRVSWDADAGIATVTDQRGRRSEFKPGEGHFTEYYPDGRVKIHPLDTPAKNINGRVLLPLRVLLENYAFQVQWHADEQLILAFDTRPSWRKLMKPDEWQKALDDDCVPCALAKVAP